jgi:lysyl-tRNA synthetase class 1
MSGKDLIDSVRLSGRICRILGSDPPVGFTYELFLDETAQKISKSRGNGLSVDEWLRYAPSESLAQFMFHQPQRAKRLFFDVIPKAVDDYVTDLSRARAQPPEEVVANPVWHIHAGHLPGAEAASALTFGMLLNLASVVNAETPDILWGFIQRYSPGSSPREMPFLDRLVRHAILYYQDFIRPKKHYRRPDAMEVAALTDLAHSLAALPADSNAETIQTEVFEVGKRHPFKDLRAWFACLYEVLLGQTEGPRFGAFAAIYGLPDTVNLIRTALARPADPA